MVASAPRGYSTSFRDWLLHAQATRRGGLRRRTQWLGGGKVALGLVPLGQLHPRVRAIGPPGHDTLGDVHLREELNEHLALRQVVEQLLARGQAHQGGTSRVAIGVVHGGDLQVTEGAAVVAAALGDGHLRHIKPVTGPVTHCVIVCTANQGLEHAGERQGLRVILRVRSDL